MGRLLRRGSVLLLGISLFFIYSPANFEGTQAGFPTCFLPVLAPEIFSQHQTSTALSRTCGRNRATPPISRSLVRSPTSTPKPRAEGSSPSAPATKPAKTLGFRRFSFCTCCMVIWCILVRTPGFLIWFYPSPTVLIPSSTRNAPGFALFRLFRVRFCVFHLFGRSKFSTWFLCTLPHSVYRLKSLVIPVRREVSFFT